MKTRVVRLRSGRQYERAANARTVIFDTAAVFPRLSYRELFLEHYPAIREVVEGYQHRGLAIVAVDQHGVVASVHLAAKPGMISGVFIGRHGACDLYLESDPHLSLRHLAVILYPLTSKRDLRYRVVDLRTPTSFIDEMGRRLEAYEAEGPTFIQCGVHLLYVFLTDEETPWPDDAESGWECIPERVHLDEAPAEPDRWLRRRLKALWGLGDKPQSTVERRRTLVQTTRGPSRARRRLLAEEDEVLGDLEVVSQDGQTILTLGRWAAKEGVLLGRYERCDNEGLSVLSDGHISRVHLLLLEIDDVLYAMDTASSNGVWKGEEEVRVVKLEPGTVLMLGNELAYVQWKGKIESTPQ